MAGDAVLKENNYLDGDARHDLQGKRYLERFTVIPFINKAKWLGLRQTKSADPPGPESSRPVLHVFLTTVRSGAHKAHTHASPHVVLPSSLLRRGEIITLTHCEDNRDWKPSDDYNISLVNENARKRRRASVSVASHTTNERDEVHTAMALLWRSENSLPLRGVFRDFSLVQLRPLHISAATCFSSPPLWYAL